MNEIKSNLTVNYRHACPKESQSAKNSQNGCTQNLSKYPTPDINTMQSRFNINFGSSSVSDIEKFSNYMENKIKHMLGITKNTNVETSQETCPLGCSKDIEMLSERFKTDGITDIYNSGISLNTALNYLVSKNQVQLGESSNKKTAFMVDELSIEYLEKLKNSQINSDNKEYEQFLSDLENNKINFYCFSSSSLEADMLAHKITEITKINPAQITFVQNCPDSKCANYPDAKTIKATIIALAKSKFPNDDNEQEKFRKLCCKYIDESLVSLSYKNLAELTKKQYKLIESSINGKGKTMDNVIYVIPKKGKSYDLINYIYASVNGIKQDKFISMDHLKNTFDDNSEDKVYVVLDDFCAGGGSNLEIFGNLNQIFKSGKQMNLIMSPIVSTQSGKFKTETEAGKRIRNGEAHIEFIPDILCKDFGYIDTLEEFAEMGSKNAGKMLDEYLVEFGMLNSSDIKYLMTNLKNGCGNTYSCTSFPYMIPDNSSDLSTILGGYFLNNDTPQANKGIESKTTVAGKRIKREDYLHLKEEIERIRQGSQNNTAK